MSSAEELPKQDGRGDAKRKQEETVEATNKQDEAGVAKIKPDEAGVAKIKPDEAGVVKTEPDKAGVAKTEPDKAGVAKIKPDEAGVAKIKQEYLLVDYKPVLETEYVSAEVKEQIQDAEEAKNPDQNPRKRIKLTGRNKDRPKGQRVDPSSKLCPSYVREVECSYGGKCKFSHDPKAFLASQPENIGSACYLFETYGKCPFGVTCRYSKCHLTEDMKNVAKDNIGDFKQRDTQITNVLKKDLQVSLWKRRYDFTRADRILDRVCPGAFDQKRRKEIPKPLGTMEKQLEKPTSKTDAGNGASSSDDLGNIEIWVTPREKKKIDFTDKLYLAPLTTVGNLPFRRICKRFGADITCGEMAVATNLLQGQLSEWALLKRHESEDLFGIQLCGAYPDAMTRCAQLITDNMDVDFIDINCGCPIDLIFNKGEGSALMGRLTKFEQIVQGMTEVLDIPLTVKLRTGIYSDKNIAHALMPRLKDWGVSLTTLHGRSRVQRYTRTADWDYISKCADAAYPMPLFGNGDILSYEEANLRREQTGVSGLMIARGALIKPWIFTEIKEQRHWDISSSERMDILRDFANYGMDHWGSDTKGVENTRRFLLEWLSFMYRYIPVGLLERVPQQINERPPYYKGRDDLETLMASPSCGDWIKISEMLLGPVPDGFTFLPKHKANAYK